MYTSAKEHENQAVEDNAEKEYPTNDVSAYILKPVAVISNVRFGNYIQVFHVPAEVVGLLSRTLWTI